jgi:hypothetical protein
MSGPISVGYLLVPAALALARAAIDEARAMKREAGAISDQAHARGDANAATRKAQERSRIVRLAAVRSDAAREAQRYARLHALAESLAARTPDLARQIPVAPQPPATEELEAWDAHLAAVADAARTLGDLIAAAGADLATDLERVLRAGSAAPDIDQVLAAYVMQRRLKPGLDAGETERFRETAARILARLGLEEGETLPPALEALAREIVLAPSVERAEALASELRLAVQKEREANAAAKLARDQETAAYVLEESLRDLGYEVEDIEETLFCDGGTVHFTRAGWENYAVRMRVNARERTANFNVVRARGDEENAERKRLDTLAEDRWCAEFPKLMETLAVRGIALDVTRRVAAGEVPVQVVDPAGLPRLHAEEDERAREPAPLARPAPR